MDNNLQLVSEKNAAQPVVAQPTVAQSKKLKITNKLLPITIILAVLAVAGIGAGVYGWLVNRDKITELEQQISAKDQKIADLQGEQPEDSAENDMENDLNIKIANNMLITSPTQVLNDEHNNEPIELFQGDSHGDCFVFLRKQVGGAFDLTSIDGPADWVIPTRISMSVNFKNINGWDKDIDAEITNIDADKVTQVFVNGYGNGLDNEQSFS